MGVILDHSPVPHCHQYNPSLEKASVLVGPEASSALTSVTCQFLFKQDEFIWKLNREQFCVLLKWMLPFFLKHALPFCDEIPQADLRYSPSGSRASPSADGVFLNLCVWSVCVFWQAPTPPSQRSSCPGGRLQFTFWLCGQTLHRADSLGAARLRRPCHLLSSTSPGFLRALPQQ